MPPNGQRWTVETLREHLTAIIDLRFESLEDIVNHRFDAQERAVKAAYDSNQRALDIADKALTSELKHVNEFRQLVDDIQENQMPSKDIVNRFVNMAEKVDELSKQMADMRSQGTGVKSGWGWAAAVIALAIAIASFFRG